MQQSLTPMLKQYYTVKEEVGDAFLFFRLGDFYEMFGEDAELASRLLEITLTSREAGRNRRIPMCGVPYHSADKYIVRLVKKGYSVAICEQVEDSDVAKGLVRREIVRIVTPGTLVDDNFLEARGNNYLLAVAWEGTDYGLAYADISTAEFKLTNLQTKEDLLNEIDRLQPAEILLSPALVEEREGLLPITTVPLHDSDDMTVERAKDTLCRHFGVMSLAGFGCEKMGAALKAAASVLSYLRQTQRQELPHITSLSAYGCSGRMILDRATVRSLELTFNMRDGSRQGTLLGVLDQTVTTMGGRLLRRWIMEPLVKVPDIECRLEAVQEMLSSRKTSELLHQHLEAVYDLERLLSRITLGQANGRDLVAFRSSLAALPDIKIVLSAAKASLLKCLGKDITLLEDIRQMIAAAIVDEPPLTLRDGGIIRDGFNEELDRLRSISKEGKGWLSRIEMQERERTGIKNLKIGFNQVFGYYIEVTRANLAQVPDEYIRKQTMANAERYITPELKDYESMILNAEERIGALEYELFNRVRDAIIPYAEEIQRTAVAVAQADVILSLAVTAGRNAYCRPVISEDDAILIKDGRHPVVERGSNAYVPNDTDIAGADSHIMIITGPNMAGKSTYLRQVALITLMAQIGSFVPASEARIGLVDRVFCRVGAHDDLAAGQSTFMVEMTEMANILNYATARSLILIDELGRGTSTFDGMSIAWSIVEALHDLGAKVLFATHYHQLNELEERLRGVRNYRVLVREEGDDIIFLHRIAVGGTDRSYGIEVARLAGIPRQVVERAKNVLHELEGRRLEMPQATPADQLNLFTAPEDPLLGEIRDLDILNMTPLEAMNRLQKIKDRLTE